MTKPNTATAQGPFQCAYCEGTFSVGFTDTDEPVILHTFPTCASYDKLETTEDGIQYMRAARKAN